MSDSNNNQNQDNASNNGTQNLNRASTYSPNSNSSDLGYGNNYSTYNRSSSYGMNDSYGGYGSGYSGYGGYGGSSGYGGYGSYSSNGGYGGYNRGYSSYGGPNQYSNQYSKPLPPNQQNEQIPPPNFRQDMWGFLNGFHAMLNVLYAATGIVHFGKIFVRMSLKIIKMICGKSIGLVFKLTGFKFLKKILMSLSATDNWSSEFNFTEQPFENAWGNGAGVNNSTIFGKILLVLRVCSLLGTGLALFLRSKMKHQNPPVDAEVLGPDVYPNDIPQKPADFERVKSFYEDIKLIEDDNQLMNQVNLPSVFNEVQEQEQEQQEVETFAHVIEESDKSVELAPENEPIKALVDSNSDISSKLAECQALLEKEEQAEEVVEAIVETANEEITAPIMKNIEKSFSMPVFERKTESDKLDITSNHNTSTTTKESITSTHQDSIISEDFWKNQDTFKAIESLQKEEKKPEESSKKEFELPSVLQTLRSNSMPSNKPWLMKKKKTMEVAAEVPQQAQPVQEKSFEKVPEVNEVCEPKLDKVIEVPEVLETPQGKVESQLENLEGTTV